MYEIVRFFEKSARQFPKFIKQVVILGFVMGIALGLFFGSAIGLVSSTFINWIKSDKTVIETPNLSNQNNRFPELQPYVPGEPISMQQYQPLPQLVNSNPKIRIGYNAFHIVRPGETLLEISQMYDSSIETIIKLNKIHYPYRVKTGSKLIIPCQAKMP